MTQITTNAAITACIKETALDRNDILSVNTRIENGLYEIDLSTSYQNYNFYVDAETAEVLGINAEPADNSHIDEEGLYVLSENSIYAA